MSNKTARVFSASLKPVWAPERIADWLAEHKGAFDAYVINHDRDVNEDGEIVEAHTHFYIEYDTPRKVSTVANLLGVEVNFIEIVRNKKGMLRYLTHKDQETKAKYFDDEVFTNAEIDYKTAVEAASMSDKDIAEYIAQGRGFELLGLVPAGKLRTIQAFLHFDTSKKLLSELENLRLDVAIMRRDINKIAEYTNKAQELADFLVDALRAAGDKTLMAAKELADALKQIKRISCR